MPIGETYPQSVTKNNAAHPDASELILEPEEHRFGMRSAARAVGMGVVALGASLGLTPGASAEPPLRADQPFIEQPFKLQDVQDTKLIEQKHRKEEARCDAQKKRDEYQYSSCEYQGAYVAIVKKFPKWSDSHKLSPPGAEDKSDRKKAFFKTHPKAYEQVKLERQMASRYMGKTAWVAQCYRWAEEADVPLNDDAIRLLDRESDCNPSVINNSSGAGGIPQALPFSKTGCELGPSGAECQIKWFYNYTNNTTYSSYAEALGHSYRYGWY